MSDDGRRGAGWPLFVDAAVTGGDEQSFCLPTGTVTFLLSDVEGSTRRWEHFPEAMALAIPRHYELLDHAISQHGGVRPVEQGEGDSVVGAFSRPSDAVAAALDAQRAMTAETWPTGNALQVRIAVHTGEAQFRNSGNYVGQALNRCARIRATGYGGQVLMSAATAELVADRLPAGAGLVDLGIHRLKDLGRPEHIWQLTHPDVQSDFPALRSLDTFRQNLPVQLAPLVGRTAEIADARRSLHGNRLLTLTGSAGVGKTRLALAIAAETVDQYPGGVWWVELAPVSDPSAVGRTALAAIGAGDLPGASAAQQLAVHLGVDPSLLVLDNCEHLIDASAGVVAELLVANLSTTVMATSREPLGVPGEITYRVPSLTCPEPERVLDVQTLSQYEAVALFLERAHRARPSFAVTAANAPAVAQICQRLDGIPLALELAAARCRQMSPERIATELDDRFRLLTGGARTVMARQQTLTASVDWSHERLDVAERVAFRRLAVFAGPFPLEAAEAVVPKPGNLDAAEVFDLLSRLVDKSLVTVIEGLDGGLRYGLLETLRAYAIDRARLADELEMLRDAHARYWADWAAPLGEAPTDAVVAEFEQFHANVRAALDWSVNDPAMGLAMLASVARVWTVSGRAGDAKSAMLQLLSEENAERHPKAWLHAANRSVEIELVVRGWPESLVIRERTAAFAAEYGDRFEQVIADWHPHLKISATLAVLEAARAHGDVYLEASASVALAYQLVDDDPSTARSHLDTTEFLVRPFPALRDFATMVRAAVDNAVGDLGSAIARAESLDSFSQAGSCAREISFAALLTCDHDALRAAVETGDRWERLASGLALWVGNARHRLRLLEGEPSEVDPDIASGAATWPPTPGTLWLLGREAIDAGAAAIVPAWARRVHDVEYAHERAVVAAIEGAATGQEDRWHEALGLALERGFPLIAVDALEGLAIAAADSESWRESVRLLGAAQRLRDETGYRWRFGFEQRALDAALMRSGAALGDDRAAAFEEGLGLDWREAGAYAQRARGERSRPQHGWSSLTPTEQRVVALVAEGLTNPLIAQRLLMGRATVKTHLAHVFAKLGVRTRAELAAEATRRRSP